MLDLMVRPERFELPTTWFVARYSIQLSYGRVVGHCSCEDGYRPYCPSLSFGVSGNVSQAWCALRASCYPIACGPARRRIIKRRPPLRQPQSQTSVTHRLRVTVSGTYCHLDRPAFVPNDGGERGIRTLDGVFDPILP